MNNKAVSAAVGVILVVVITVAIAATVFVYYHVYVADEPEDQAEKRYDLQLLEIHEDRDIIVATMKLSNISSLRFEDKNDGFEAHFLARGYDVRVVNKTQICVPYSVDIYKLITNSTEDPLVFEIELTDLSKRNCKCKMVTIEMISGSYVREIEPIYII